jgi:hypothetical protein
LASTPPSQKAAYFVEAMLNSGKFDHLSLSFSFSGR